ncbi:hypothetical protein DPMN_040562 [Dreissena polymorpha]|uniref:Uncharacterized protein n=1 Tax=Dreissena polymorpha TaxID=45954 RepID=A0A9D4HV59_DREPO|nr:hypothetical protein DPMN_040562 [Dreissena polymorpha]
MIKNVKCGPASTEEPMQPFMCYSNFHKNVPPSGGHDLKPTGTIFKLVRNIIGTNCLTKFHEDRTINVASRVLKRNNGPPFGAHVFEPTGTIFELVQDIIRTNLLTTFHDDRQ